MISNKKEVTAKEKLEEIRGDIEEPEAKALINTVLHSKEHPGADQT